MSLLFNSLPRFIIAFLSRSKCLLISWLESFSTVILEPNKIKSVTASTFSPFVCHKVMGQDVMILVIWMLSFKPAFSVSSFTLIKRFFAAAKLLQSCPTLCDLIDGSPPGSPVPGILQARTLEWVAVSFSNAWKGKVKVKSLSCIWLLVTPWTAAHQAPPSMGFSRQEYWSGVPLPSPQEVL